MKLELRRRTATRLLQAAALLVCVSPSFAAEPPPLPPVTSVAGSPRLPGKFVWADLVTDDVAGAKKFYGELFNWTFRDLGGYVVAANEERPLCGMFQRPKPSDRTQARPRWFGYLSVNSVAHRQEAGSGCSEQSLHY